MKQRILSCFATLAALAFLGACASRVVSSTGLELMTESAYQNVTDNYTERNQTYQGLYNTLDLTATLVNSAVARAQLEQNARLYQWDRAKFQGETNKAAEKLRNESLVFLSFYTPDRKNDDLHKSSTQWRVYLESDGRRFEGKVTKNKLQLSELQGIYSYHNRFATPYMITFPVAMTSIESKPVKFTLTGPVGIAVLTFKAQSPTESTVQMPPVVAPTNP
jgi:hypothetical protein